jgi:cysteine desulfuration protein SufE
MNSAAGVREKQSALIARFSQIEDLHERLSAVVSRGKQAPALPESERTDQRRVQGCVSRVWLAGSVADGRCHFRIAADSPLVLGLVALLCELYEGATSAEIVSVEPEIFEALAIARQLSPTRLNGIASVRRAIREFAAGQLA